MNNKIKMKFDVVIRLEPGSLEESKFPTIGRLMPKCLFPLNGRPLLQYILAQVSNLKPYISKVHIIYQGNNAHKRHMISAFLIAYNNLIYPELFDFKLHFIDEKQPFLAYLASIQLDGDYFLLHYDDVIIADLGKSIFQNLLDTHLSVRSHLQTNRNVVPAVTLAIGQFVFTNVGQVAYMLDHRFIKITNKVTHFVEHGTQNPTAGYNNMAIGIFDKSIREKIAHGTNEEKESIYKWLADEMKHDNRLNIFCVKCEPIWAHLDDYSSFIGKPIQNEEFIATLEQHFEDRSENFICDINPFETETVAYKGYVAFLGIDIAGSRPLYSEDNDVLSRFRSFVNSRCRRFGGAEYEYHGDGGRFAFIMGNAAENATLSALNLLGDMDVFNLCINPSTSKLTIRLVLHGGDIEMKDELKYTTKNDDVLRICYLEKAKMNGFFITEGIYDKLSAKLQNAFKPVKSDELPAEEKERQKENSSSSLYKFSPNTEQSFPLRKST
jgi:hypothetical protein